MINRLILTNQKPAVLVLAFLGALIGFSLLMAAFQVYLDFSDLLTNKNDLIRSEYIMINKRVSMLNTLSLGNTEFTPEEIKEIEAQPFVEKVGVFTSNAFAANVFVKKGEKSLIPPMYADLFFEAVPDEFIDVKTGKWRWSPGDSTVPVIVPSEYLKLYNFGFAPSQGFPVVSEKMVEMAPFRIGVRGPQKEANFQGKIVGLSDRINSLLIPQTFMEYANKEFAPDVKKRPSRLVMVSDDPASPQLKTFLEEKGYDVNSESLRNSELNTVLKIIVSVAVFLGTMIVMLSVLCFMLYGMLVISNSAYEIKTLVQLGYHWMKISTRYIIYYLVLFSVILVIAIGLLFLMKNYFNSYMEKRGFELEDMLHPYVLLTGIVLLAAFVALNAASVVVNVRKLAKAGN